MWSLDLEMPASSSVSAVVHARDSAKNPVTLKLLVDASEFAAEREALIAFGGRGSIRLIAEAPAMSALLLERAVPGDALSALVKTGQEDLANQAAADVMHRLKTPASKSQVDELTHIGSEAMATLERYVHVYGTTPSGPITGRQIAQARSLIDALQQSEEAVVLLHADLHHDNLLAAERERWLAIDPKGRIGDPAAELAAFIRNPIDHLATVTDFAGLLRRRVSQLIELLDYDRERVLAWTIGLATVAACWALEDGASGWEAWLRVADALQ
jgi:streptomycin 6-kinase